MMTFIRDWRRGYSDADVEKARHEIDGLPVLRGRPDHVMLRLTRRQWRAFFGERMSADDGMLDAAGCHLPPVRFALVGANMNLPIGDLETMRRLVR